MGVESTKKRVLSEVTRVLVVEHDSTSLKVVSKMLQLCGYEVVTANYAIDALTIAREREDDIHVILAEVHLPDMGRYEFLEKMEQTSKSPIVIMSADDNEISKLGCLFKGAMLYLVKPLAMKSIRNLWQFPFIKRREKTPSIEALNQVREESTYKNDSSENIGDPLMKNEMKKCQKMKRKCPTELEEEEEEEDVDSTVLKKPKLFWTEELHSRFLQAIEVLGIEKAHPKEILHQMSIPGLRKENISSHLQKFRLALKRDRDAKQKPTSKSQIIGDGSVRFSNQQLLLDPSYLSHFGRQLPNNVGTFMAKPSTSQETQPQPSNNNLNSTSPTSNLIGSFDRVGLGNLTSSNNDNDPRFSKATPNETHLVNSTQQQPLKDEMGHDNSFEREIEEMTTWSSIQLPSLVNDRRDMFKVNIELDEIFDIVENSNMNFYDEDFDNFWL